MNTRQMQRIEASQARIEAKLDRLIGLLADPPQDEQDDDLGSDLEGAPLPAARDPHEPL